MSIIKNILFSGHTFTKVERELAFKYKTTNIIFILATLAYFINSYTYTLMPQYQEIYLGQSNLIGGSLLVLSMLLLRMDKKYYTFFTSVNFFIFYGVASYALYFQADNFTRLLWFVVPIIVSTILLPRWMQKVFVALSMVLIITYVIQPFYSHSFNTVTIQESLFLGIILVTFTFVVQIKYFRDNKKLQKLNKVLKSQHDKLEQLNQHLDEQVKIEVEKNRKKDTILLEQSRLVQSSDLLSKIAHHWRQPLASISSASAMGFLQLSDADCKPELIEQTFQNINQLVQDLSKSISRFQNYFKPDSTISEITVEALFDAFKGFNQDYFSKDILRFEYPKEPVTITTYVNELLKVSFNLLLNSHESIALHKPENPAITVTATVQEGQTVIEIKDNGTTIPKDVMHRIYDPYFSTKEEKNDTGLGLYMAKMIIEKHCQGSLEIENNTEENGVTARMRIPSLTR